jgi:CBS domain-containing protein
LYTILEQIVADHMTRNVKTVTRGVSLRELGDLFEKDDFNAYPVEEGSQIVGVVSKFDHLACFVFTPAFMMPRYEDLMRRTVADVMTSEFIYVGEDTKLTRVLDRSSVTTPLRWTMPSRTMTLRPNGHQSFFASASMTRLRM